MKISYDILFVLGPSGVGKSCFAQYLAQEHHWLHLEIDDPHGDGIDIYSLRRSWDLFYKSTAPSELAMELRGRMEAAARPGCVLSFGSTVVLPLDHIEAAKRESIRIAYLYGTAAQCIDAFLNRERSSGRNLSLDHWLTYNQETYITMSRPEFGPYRTQVFDIHGRHRPNVEVLRDIEEK